MYFVMKKITLFFSLLFAVATLSAQSLVRVNFEDNALNGASVIYNGSVSVIANPVTSGANGSAYCLDVVNNGYAPLKIGSFTVPAGTASTYPYWKLRFKIAYKGYNGGSDLDYPSVDVFSSPASPVLDATEKLGSVSSVWGTHGASADSMQWKVAEFTMSSSALASIPAGTLVLKLAKSKCEYLIDDIELVPSLTNGFDFLSITDFESATAGDALTYPMTNIYGSAAAGTSVVAADPLTSTAKALSVSPTSYNNAASISVALPSGKYMNSYDYLYFDRYSAATQYAQLYVKYGSTVLYKDNGSQYPSQSGGAWSTKVYGIPSSVSSSTSSFNILIGYTSMSSGTFFLDNIKLHAIYVSTTTGTDASADAKPLFVSVEPSAFRLSQTADRVELFSINGQRLQVLSNTNSVETSHLNAGVYILKSVIGSQTFVNKVIR
jgi:hypothetical protein